MGTSGVFRTDGETLLKLDLCELSLEMGAEADSLNSAQGSSGPSVWDSYCHQLVQSCRALLFRKMAFQQTQATPCLPKSRVLVLQFYAGRFQLKQRRLSCLRDRTPRVPPARTDSWEDACCTSSLRRRSSWEEMTSLCGDAMTAASS